MIGMFTDFFQRTLTDVGAAGPDRGEGGLYLLLAPDYQGTVPAGYYTFRSATYNVFLFFRTVLTQGPDGPDGREAVALAEMTRIYPWGSLEKYCRSGCRNPWRVQHSRRELRPIGTSNRGVTALRGWLIGTTIFPRCGARINF